MDRRNLRARGTMVYNASKRTTPKKSAGRINSKQSLNYHLPLFCLKLPPSPFFRRCRNDPQSLAVAPEANEMAQAPQAEARAGKERKWNIE